MIFSHKRITRYNSVLLFFLFPLAGFAQIDHAFFSAGSDSLVYAQITAIEIPAVPFKQRSAPGRDQIKDPLVAYNHTCSFTPEESGDWKTTGTYKTWFLKIRSSGAYGMALVFANVKLLTGERLYIHTRHGIGGVYTKYTIPASGVLPLSFLPGDELLVEYRVPQRTRRGTFTIASVSHAYVDIFSKHGSFQGAQTQVNRDKDCYACLEGDSIQLAKRSVVKILVHGEDGSRFCTGTLVNNTAEDRRPLIITAQHCIVSQAEADRSVFVFNYDDLCGNSVPVEIQQLQGASLRASSLEHDYTLVELYHYPPLGGRPYYSGWNLSERPATSVLSVHHPQGGPKKISLSSGAVVSGDFPGDNLRAPDAFWKIGRWNGGATETGSSGAPLFNHRYQVIGTLTGGSASCASPYNDYFEKLSSSTQASNALRQWLDPLDSRVAEFNGLDPFQNINPDCHSISNIDPNEFTGLEPHSSGEGYYSGYNGAQIASYAERFSVPGRMMLTGASFSIGSVNANASGGVLFALHVPDDSGLPGAVLHETFVPYQALGDLTGYIEFYPYVEIEGEFFVSYTLNYSPLDVFALNQALWRNSGDNTAYVKTSSAWIPLIEVSPQNAGTAFSIRVTVCNDVSIPPAEEKLVVDFYPNPSSAIVICKPHFELTKMYRLEVFDSQGRIQQGNHQVIDNNIVLHIADLRSGMYVVRLTTANKTYTAKVIRE